MFQCISPLSLIILKSLNYRPSAFCVTWYFSFASLLFLITLYPLPLWAGKRSQYSDWLWAGRSRDRIPVRSRFSAPVQTGPGAHPANCTIGTRSFPGVKSGRGMTLTSNPLLGPWSWKGRAIPLFPLWAVRPVQSLRACTGVHFTFFTFYALPLPENQCC
jgi:hypothetical protein